MNYGKIEKCDFTNAINGIHTSLWVSGCDKVPKCKNCWNKVAWDFDYGYKYTKNTEKMILGYISKPYITGLSLIGGEIFSNLQGGELLKLVKEVENTYNKKVLCFTGYTFEQLIKNQTNVEFMQHIDYLIDGEYIEELKNLKNFLRNSENQRIINCKESLKQGKVIEYDFNQRSCN